MITDNLMADKIKAVIKAYDLWKKLSQKFLFPKVDTFLLSYFMFGFITLPFAHPKNGKKIILSEFLFMLYPKPRRGHNKREIPNTNMSGVKSYYPAL